MCEGLVHWRQHPWFGHLRRTLPVRHGWLDWRSFAPAAASSRRSPSTATPLSSSSRAGLIRPTLGNAWPNWPMACRSSPTRRVARSSCSVGPARGRQWCGTSSSSRHCWRRACPSGGLERAAAFFGIVVDGSGLVSQAQRTLMLFELLVTLLDQLDTQTLLHVTRLGGGAGLAAAGVVWRRAAATRPLAAGNRGPGGRHADWRLGGPGRARSPPPREQSGPAGAGAAGSGRRLAAASRPMRTSRAPCPGTRPATSRCAWRSWSPRR